ncbi:MAG: terminase gpA endonuclease subunit [Gemmataceae bacterium]
MGYDRHRERQAEQQRQQSRSARDIGPIPEIGNIRRRSRCRHSLKLFCETYNPEAFALAWSDDHLRAIARLEEAATQGALYAFAMPRGSGKSTLSRMAALWALSYRHCRYVFTIGANMAKAREAMEAVKTWVRFLPRYIEDFPEIAYPVTRLAGIAQRAVGQLAAGVPTLIEWSQDRVIFPTVLPPANWPKSWKLRGDGYVPTSGAALSAAGLTSDGIRGSLLTLSTGETIRPDLVLLDDPQTPESAVSPTQNEKRERLISADVLGMAGPGQTISAVMPCTVIASNDMADRILTRSLHPLWRGERTRLLRRMPDDLEHWEEYLEVYRQCAQLEPPDFAQAVAYYQAHQEKLEAGCEASWPQRKLPWEVSAIQHAIHLYARSPSAFFAEYQNAPRAAKSQASSELTANQIAEKVHGLDRGAVPLASSRLTAFIDVQGALLYWMVAGWADDFTGGVLDYGAFPDQARPYFTLRDARPALGSLLPGAGVEAVIYAGLEALTKQLLGRIWRREDGAELRVERCLIDANWGTSTDVVYQFCRQSSHASVVMPSHGRYVGASSRPFSEYRTSPGDRVGNNWRIPVVQGRAVRHVLFDTNAWKSFVFARLAVPVGQRGCLSLFGASPDVHRLLADHLTAEYRVTTTGRGRTVEEWKIRPDRRDNHWLDCLAGCAVAASVQGCSFDAGAVAGVPAPPRRKRLTLAEAMTLKEIRRL